MSRGLLLFDFDGVIVDSFPISFAILRGNNPGITEDDYRDCFVGNFHDDGVVSRPDIQWGTVEEFFPRYAEELLETPPVSHMDSLISDFSTRYTQVIVSSTINSPIQQYLEAYNLDPYFEEIMGKENGHNKTQKIQTAIDRYGKGQKTVFITDTLGDIKEANEAGIPSIGVTWGFHDREILEKGNPKAIVDRPEYLSEVIEKVLQ